MFDSLNTSRNYTCSNFLKLRINLVKFSLNVYFVQDVLATENSDSECNVSLK